MVANKLEKWTNISLQDFLHSASRPDSRIDVIWTKNFDISTRARRCIIKSKTTWRARISRSFLPWYVDDKSYLDVDAENLTVLEAALKFRERWMGLTGTTIPIITSVYDTRLRKRLIVDGCKRSCAIQNEFYNNKKILLTNVIECYGPNVSHTFSSDFNPILRKFGKK